MTCINGLGSTADDYVIYVIPIYNKLIDFNILNNLELDSNHRPLIITLNIAMHSDPKEENYHFQKHLIFDKNTVDIFLHDLKNELFTLSSMDNIENIHDNFATTLSSSINKFSIEVSTKMSNSITNRWYDQESKYVRKEIKQATTYLIKMDKINQYKSLTKRRRKKDNI